MKRGFAQEITTNTDIAVDLATEIGKSSFSTGMSHIDQSLVNGDPTAITNVKNLLKSAVTYQNTFIMSWGVGDPWPDPATAEPDNWGSLDNRLSTIVGMGATPMITLMNAPWWMKGQLQADGTTKLIPDAKGEWGSYTYSAVKDYRGINYPAGYVSPDPISARILDNQMGKWLHLVQRVAERYMVAPYNVRYFQVWNELKGYYNPAISRWDYENQAGNTGGYNARHGYTYLYNQVYQVLRNVAVTKGIDPNSIKIGGPYAEIKTWTAADAGGFPAQEAKLQNKPYGTYDQRDLDVMKYWLQNKAGAGFIAIDVKNRNRELTALTDPFTANNKFADVNQWIRSLDNNLYPGAATLPIISAEWYANPYETYDRAYNNAVKADAVIKSLKAGSAIILNWGGVENTTNWKINPSMYTNTDVTGGGKALPWYYSYKAFHDYFGPGTSLQSTTQSTADISVLSSPVKTMLVNKKNASQTVTVNGVQYTLAAYEVRIVNTPAQSSPSPTPTLKPTSTSTPTAKPTSANTPTPGPTSRPSPTPTSKPALTGAPTSTPTRTPTATVDTTSPSVAITNPKTGSIVSRGTTVTITATASDNVRVDRVVFAIIGKGGNYNCTDTVSPYSCSWPVPVKPSTLYTIKATAYDSRGNSASAQINVTSSK